MAAPVDLKNYKVAKNFIQDSALVLKIIELSLQGLKQFTKYKPVSNLVSDMEGAKRLLEAHLNTANKIVKKAKSSGEESGS